MMLHCYTESLCYTARLDLWASILGKLSAWWLVDRRGWQHDSGIYWHEINYQDRRFSLIGPVVGAKAPRCFISAWGSETYLTFMSFYNSSKNLIYKNSLKAFTDKAFSNSPKFIDLRARTPKEVVFHLVSTLYWKLTDPRPYFLEIKTSTVLPHPLKNCGEFWSIYANETALSPSNFIFIHVHAPRLIKY